MQQAAMSLPIEYHTSQVSEDKDPIGLGLLLLVLLLLPIQRLMLPFNLSIVDLVLVLLTIYGLSKAWRAQQRFAFPLLLPMWLILFASLIATLVGLGHPDSIIAIVQEIYLFTWFVVLTNLLRTFPMSDMDRLMKIWSLVACVESLTMVMGMLRFGPSMFYIKPSRDLTIETSIVRAIGTFVNSNAAAVYLSISLFVLIATSWSFWLRLVLGGWIFVGIFASGSNGAILSSLGAFAIVVMLFPMLSDHRKMLSWVGLLSVISGFIGLAALAFAIVPDLWSGFSFDFRLDTSQELLFYTLGRFSYSLERRFEIIKWAWNIYVRHPWGTGPNSFSTIISSLHNDYVAFLFERGPLGLMGWLWVIGATLWKPLQAGSQFIEKRHRWPVLGLGAGFLACSVNAISHEVSHMRQVWMLMVFLFAVSINCIEQQSQRSEVSTPSKKYLTPDKGQTII